MLKPATPMSNAERQRRFQAAHPGYDRRRKARQRAGLKAYGERKKAERLAAAAAGEPLALPEPAVTPPVERVMLALPAPAVVPVLPGLNALNAITATAERVAERVAA
jgi:hypothetical protein